MDSVVLWYLLCSGTFLLQIDLSLGQTILLGVQQVKVTSVEKEIDFVEILGCILDVV